MPATSVKQRRLMAIAEHDPGALYPENKGVAQMSQSQLHDFAKTKESNLPTKRGYGSDKRSQHGRHKKSRGY